MNHESSFNKRAADELRERLINSIQSFGSITSVSSGIDYGSSAIIVNVVAEPNNRHTATNVVSNVHVTVIISSGLTTVPYVGVYTVTKQIRDTLQPILLNIVNQFAAELFGL